MPILNIPDTIDIDFDALTNEQRNAIQLIMEGEGLKNPLAKKIKECTDLVEQQISLIEEFNLVEVGINEQQRTDLVFLLTALNIAFEELRLFSDKISGSSKGTLNDFFERLSVAGTYTRIMKSISGKDEEKYSYIFDVVMGGGDLCLDRVLKHLSCNDTATNTVCGNLDAGAGIVGLSQYIRNNPSDIISIITCLIPSIIECVRNLTDDDKYCKARQIIDRYAIGEKISSDILNDPLYNEVIKQVVGSYELKQSLLELEREIEATDFATRTTSKFFKEFPYEPPVPQSNTENLDDNCDGCCEVSVKFEPLEFDCTRNIIFVGPTGPPGRNKDAPAGPVGPPGPTGECDCQPIILGACCIGVSCLEATQNQCSYYGGDYYGDGTSCTQVFCSDGSNCETDLHCTYPQICCDGECTTPCSSEFGGGCPPCPECPDEQFSCGGECCSGCCVWGGESFICEDCGGNNHSCCGADGCCPNDKCCGNVCCEGTQICCRGQCHDITDIECCGEYDNFEPCSNGYDVECCPEGECCFDDDGKPMCCDDCCHGACCNDNQQCCTHSITNDVSRCCPLNHCCCEGIDAEGNPFLSCCDDNHICCNGQCIINTSEDFRHCNPDYCTSNEKCKEPCYDQLRDEVACCMHWETCCGGECFNTTDDTREDYVGEWFTCCQNDIENSPHFGEWKGCIFGCCPFPNWQTGEIVCRSGPGNVFEGSRPGDCGTSNGTCADCPCPCWCSCNTDGFGGGWMDEEGFGCKKWCHITDSGENYCEAGGCPDWDDMYIPRDTSNCLLECYNPDPDGELWHWHLEGCEVICGPSFDGPECEEIGCDPYNSPCAPCNIADWENSTGCCVPSGLAEGGDCGDLQCGIIPAYRKCCPAEKEMCGRIAGGFGGPCTDFECCSTRCYSTKYDNQSDACPTDGGIGGEDISYYHGGCCPCPWEKTVPSDLCPNSMPCSMDCTPDGGHEFRNFGGDGDNFRGDGTTKWNDLFNISNIKDEYDIQGRFIKTSATGTRKTKKEVTGLGNELAEDVPLAKPNTQPSMTANIQFQIVNFVADDGIKSVPRSYASQSNPSEEVQSNISVAELRDTEDLGKAGFEGFGTSAKTIKGSMTVSIHSDGTIGNSPLISFVNGSNIRLDTNEASNIIRISVDDLNLFELVDVDASSPTNEDILRFDIEDLKWKSSNDIPVGPKGPTGAMKSQYIDNDYGILYNLDELGKPVLAGTTSDFTYNPFPDYQHSIVGITASVEFNSGFTGSGTSYINYNEFNRATFKDTSEVFSPTAFSNGETAGQAVVDFGDGNVQYAIGTGDGASTHKIALVNPPPSGIAGTATLIITNGGQLTQTLFAENAIWPGGIEPTLSSNGIDILSFLTVDGGTTYYGFLNGTDMI